MIVILKVCVGLIFNFLFWFGIYDNIINIKPNNCEMTYMYEYPQYLEVKMNNNAFPKYKLYAYGEGQYANELANKDYRGIPVLFIPGNQGSYKQVRSLASVAYQKSKNGGSFHFNYFSVDFNEEIGALFGPVLQHQTSFVGQAIKTIMNLYKKSHKKHKSIVLVGHSMGGIVARAAASANISPVVISLIITLATPHSRPIIIPDSSLVSFHENVNKNWALKMNSSLANTALVTVGGGKNDFHVPSSLTTSAYADVDETLLSVPLCWLTTDHLAIVWCKQLVLAVTRALFDSVDKTSLQLSSDRTHIVNAFKDHLSERTGEKDSFNSVKKRILERIKRKEDWVELGVKQHTEIIENLKPKLIAVPISRYQGQHASIVIHGKAARSWIIACSAEFKNERVDISNGENLNRYTRLIAGDRKEANIDLLFLRDYTHILVYIEPSTYKASVDIDVSYEASRQFEVAAPPFKSFSPVVITNSTAPKSLTMNITIEGFTDFWQSYILSFTPIGECSSDFRYPLVSIQSSWTSRREAAMTLHNPYDFSLRLDIPSPVYDEGTVDVHVVKSPSCDYSVSLQKSVRGIFERISLHYASQVPVFVICQLLIVLSSQLKTMSGERKSFFSHLSQTSPITVVPLSKISAFLLSKFTYIESDRAYLEKYRMNIEIMPIVVFVSSLPITLCISVLLKFVVAIISRALRKCFVRNSEGGSVERSDESPFDSHSSVSAWFSIWSIAAIIILAIGVSTCGSLALLIASCAYLIKIVQIPKSNLRRRSLAASSKEESSPSDRVESDNSSLIDFHFTILLLTILVSILNLPTFVVWARNLRSGDHLTADPSLTVSLIIVLSLGVIWQIKSIDNTKYFRHIGYLVHLSAICVVIFSTTFIYRASGIVACTLVIIAVHKLIAPK